MPDNKSTSTASQHSPEKVLRVLWSLNRGGAEVRAVDVVRNLDPDRVRVDFVALSGKPSEMDEMVRGLGSQIHYLPLTKSFPIQFWNLLKQEKPVCVHCQLTLFSGFIMLLAWLARIPQRVTSYHNMYGTAREKLSGKLYAGLMRWLVRSCATDIVAVSEATLDHCYGNQWRKDSRCQIVYQGFPQNNPSREQVRQVRQELGLQTGPVIVNVGNFRTVKNQIRALEIFSELLKREPNAHFLIAGGTHGYEESEINFAAFQEEVARKQLTGHVHLLGPRHDVNVLLAAADLMLFTSITEGCANVIWEAIAQGTPVLTSELPIVDELSRYMSGVTQCSLQDENNTWVEAAGKILTRSGNEILRQKLRKEFETGPLNVQQTCLNYEKIWTGQIPAPALKRAA